MKLLVFLTILSSLQAQKELTREILPGGSSIALIAPLAVLPAGGFASIRVEMENKTSKDVSWNLKTTSTSTNYNYYGPRSSNSSSKVTSSFGVSCPAGSVRLVDLVVPVHQSNENGVYHRNVRISGSSPSYPDFEIFAYLDGSAGFRSSWKWASVGSRNLPRIMPPARGW